MIRWKPSLVIPVSAALFLISAVSGCHKSSCDLMGNIEPMPLGTLSDPIWRTQEANGEASDFVVHQHEWIGNSAVLNEAGKDHVKQIAARAIEQKFPILIEPSNRSVRPDTKYNYPVHNDSELDASRRALIVEALQILGVDDADVRVVVAPELTPGSYSFKGVRNFSRGFSAQSGQIGGGGGGGGGGL